MKVTNTKTIILTVSLIIFCLNVGSANANVWEWFLDKTIGSYLEKKTDEIVDGKAEKKAKEMIAKKEEETRKVREKWIIVLVIMAGCGIAAFLLVGVARRLAKLRMRG